jgi:hypothetical protein
MGTEEPDRQHARPILESRDQAKVVARVKSQRVPPTRGPVAVLFDVLTSPLQIYFALQ